MSKRAIRRAHRARLKAKRKNYYSAFGFSLKDDRYSKTRAAIAINTPCPCSCYICGNPRKFFKDKKLDELISNIDFKEQVEYITDETF